MNYLTAKALEKVARWPFLKFYKVSKNYDCCWDDELPKGWRIAFGEMMWNEIKDALVANDELASMSIQDVKEKWGRLRVYFSCGPKSAQKVDKIILKYSELSAHICIMCGEPDVGYMTKGWIEPLCKNCYVAPFKDKDFTQKEIDEYYADDISDEKRMADFARWISCSGDREVEHALWIKETADKIRAKWEETH